MSNIIICMAMSVANIASMHGFEKSILMRLHLSVVAIYVHIIELYEFSLYHSKQITLEHLASSSVFI